MTELTTEPIRLLKYQNIMAHIRFKTHYPRCKIAAHYEPPHECKNKAIDVPLVSARVYPVSTKEELCSDFQQEPVFRKPC